MKERPILFSAPMVRALLDGSKTQTRRIIKDQSIGERFSHINDDGLAHLEWLGDPRCGSGVWDVPEYSANVAAPYGKPGDRLWVRENFAEVPRHEPRTDEDMPWREDGRILVYAADHDWRGSRQFLCADGVLRWARPERWRPSIHMPRWASRITLEITGVRVERLQDISEADAIAEGVNIHPDHHGKPRTSLYSPVQAYRDLWEQINGPESWAANPCVWVLDFRRVEGGAA